MPVIWEPDDAGGGGGGSGAGSIGDIVRVVVGPDYQTGGAASVGANNIARYMRTAGAATISSIAMRVGASSGTLSVAVYGTNGAAGQANRPAAQKRTSGSVACPSGGDATVALASSIEVANGDWFGLASSTTAASFIKWDSNSTSTLSDGWSALESSAHPLPATATPSGGNRSYSLIGVP
jgi:hypothetical protein